MQFSSFITNKIIKKLIEWDPELWWVDILHNSNFNFFKDLQNLLNSYKNHILYSIVMMNKYISLNMEQKILVILLG